MMTDVDNIREVVFDLIQILQIKKLIDFGEADRLKKSLSSK